MKIVHAADLHIDSPLWGLKEYDGAPIVEVRRATRRALVALIDYCLTEAVSFLLISGDLYDGDYRDYGTALFFSEQIARLREVGTQVVWIRGNHDAESRITRHLRLPSGVTELATEAPQTVRFEKEGVALHGQGYAVRDVTQNLARTYPAPSSGLFNVGMLHTALDGREGHMPYAPCRLEELTAHGYDYWALGHVHQSEVLASAPWVVYPGNLQGRHAREVGKKGAMVFQVDDLRASRPELVAFDAVRWVDLIVDVPGAFHLDEAVELVSAQLKRALDDADGRTLAARVSLLVQDRGLLGPPDERLVAEIRAVGLEAGQIYIESVECRPCPELGLGRVLLRTDALGDLMKSLAEAPTDSELRAELVGLLSAELSGMPQELVRKELETYENVLAEACGLLEAKLFRNSKEGVD